MYSHKYIAKSEWTLVLCSRHIFKTQNKVMTSGCIIPRLYKPV